MPSEPVSNRVDVFRRGPKAIYNRRKRAQEPDPKISKSRDTSDQTEDHSAVGSVVNLRSTLELFGSSSFKLEAYLERRIGHTKNENAHKQELANRRALLNGALKTFVTDHYQMFIHTSQEIENIEADLAELHTSLSQYKVSLKKLQDANMSQILSSDIEEISASSNSLSKIQTTYVGFVNEVIEELNMLRYERKLEQATSVLEMAFKKCDNETEEVAAAKDLLCSEREKVVDLCTEMFQNQVLKANERRCYLVYIIRLGYPDKASKLFFSQRSSLLRTGQSQIRSTGDLTSFVTDMSGVVFSSIGHGWVEFKRIFRESFRDSSFYSWALTELCNFCNTVRAQVFHPETPFRTSCQCVHLIILACKMLEKQGIKFSFILDTFFTENLKVALKQYLASARQAITKAVNEENWVVESAWIKQSYHPELSDKGTDKLDITKSARILYDVIHQYIVDLKLVVLNPALFDPTINDLLPIAINGVRVIFEEYLVHLASAAKAPDMTDKKGSAMIQNSRSLAEDLYPRVIKQLGPRLQKRKGLDDIVSFHEQLKKFHKAQKDYFAHQRTDVITSSDSAKVI